MTLVSSRLLVVSLHSQPLPSQNNPRDHSYVGSLDIDFPLLISCPLRQHVPSLELLTLLPDSSSGLANHRSFVDSIPPRLYAQLPKSLSLLGSSHQHQLFRPLPQVHNPPITPLVQILPTDSVDALNPEPHFFDLLPKSTSLFYMHFTCNRFRQSSPKNVVSPCRCQPYPYEPFVHGSFISTCPDGAQSFFCPSTVSLLLISWSNKTYKGAPRIRVQRLFPAPRVLILAALSRGS